MKRGAQLYNFFTCFFLDSGRRRSGGVVSGIGEASESSSRSPNTGFGAISETATEACGLVDVPQATVLVDGDRRRDDGPQAEETGKTAGSVH